MKRERPADDIRRLAIKARLQGMPSQQIARHLDRSYHTVRYHLGNCGAVRAGRYHLNALTARALFTEQELVALGAVWNGRWWIGRAQQRRAVSELSRCTEVAPTERRSARVTI